MFETVKTAPADPILGLTETFNQDPNPNKINLTVGVYKDGSGKTPVLATVKEAERRLLQAETTKSYLPMTGDPTYGSLVQKLMFGDGHGIVAEGRGATRPVRSEAAPSTVDPRRETDPVPSGGLARLLPGRPEMPARERALLSPMPEPFARTSDRSQ